MTTAVCLKCGAMKFGAWIGCPECHFEPDDDESMTKHLLVTDHHYSLEELTQIAERVKSGKEITFDPETLKAAWVSAEKVRRQDSRMTVGCVTLLVIVTLVVVGSILFTLRT